MVWVLFISIECKAKILFPKKMIDCLKRTEISQGFVIYLVNCEGSNSWHAFHDWSSSDPKLQNGLNIGPFPVSPWKDGVNNSISFSFETPGASWLPISMGFPRESLTSPAMTFQWNDTKIPKPFEMVQTLHSVPSVCQSKLSCSWRGHHRWHF